MVVEARHLFRGCRLRIDLDEGTVRTEFGPAPAALSAAPEWIFCPPLIDLQVNGGFGIDLQDPELTEANFWVLCEKLAGQGVAAWLPTLITDDIRALNRKIARLGEWVRKWRDMPTGRGGACPLGIHLEGPFISPEEGARGAHPREHVMPASAAAFDQFQESAGGMIRCVTLAPEVPGGLDLIQHIRDRYPAVLIGIGHTLADGETIQEAVRAGARISTHLGNGLPVMVHRHRNPLWAQLAEPGLCASLIPDLHHLPPETLRAFLSAKGARHTVFVSDAVCLAGQPPGTYSLFGAEVEKKADGRVCLKGTELLAGSGTMLLEGLIRAVNSGVLSLETAWEGGSRVPAALLDCPEYMAPFSNGGTVQNGILLRQEGGGNQPSLAPCCVWVNGCRYL